MLNRILRLASVAFALLALSGAAVAGAPLAGQRVLWLGDSITQAGEYVTLTTYYLQKAYPTEHFDVISIGRSSETLSGLSEQTHPGPRPCLFDRLPRALSLTKPAWVVACYGMNDGIYHPLSPERFAAFQAGVRRLIRETHAIGAQLILLTPPPFEPSPLKQLEPATAPDFSYRKPFEGYDGVLGEFARWEGSLRPDEAQVIDLHGPMDAVLAERRRAAPQFTFAADAIHPNSAGHLLMAQLVVRGLGVPLKTDGGSLEEQFARIQADPLYALIKQQRELRSAAWLPYVGLPGAVEHAESEFQRLQQQIERVQGAGAEKR